MFKAEGMGVPLSEEQREDIVHLSTSNKGVSLSGQTSEEDYEEAAFVRRICDQERACTWRMLADFVDGGREDVVVGDLRQTNKTVASFTSPIAEQLQKSISKWDRDDVDFTADNLFGDEAEEETYGEVDRTAIRKTIMESIDDILGSRKFPDRYAVRLQESVAEMVSSIQNDRNLETIGKGTDNEDRFDFPGDYCGNNQSPEKRLKNSLG
jgi:hypothetical protein